MYLSESPEDDLSLPDGGDQPIPRLPTRQLRTLEEGPTDPWIIDTVISEVCGFLRVPAENVREDSLLLSLGLDSLKTVALSQRLRGRGLLVSPMDIIKAGSVSGVISASVTEGRQELPSDRENDSGVEQLLRQDLPADSIRLNPDDEVQITAATALQAGMLSQVTSVQI